MEEAVPGDRWRTAWEASEAAYSRWFLKEGDAARPAYGECLRALREHMPELIPIYETVVELAGATDMAARLLSLWKPTPYLTACSQAVWRRGPVLIRNYDYSPVLCDAVMWHTAWFGRSVIAMSDCLWGALDGMNEDGLTVSLAFGGRKVVGDGFGIPLVLRYILETCVRTREATRVLERVPSHMAYNVTITDSRGETRTVLVAPDRHAVVTKEALATNHQGPVEWRRFARATSSEQREVFLRERLSDGAESLDRLIGRFLEPPLYAAAHGDGWGTLYTAVYRPEEGSVDLLWPAAGWRQSFDGFVERTETICYG